MLSAPRSLLQTKIGGTEMFKTKMTMIMLIVALFTSGLFAQYTSDLTGSGTVTASSILSGSTPAENAFDDDQWTHWESDGHQGGFHWVKYDFGSGQEVAITQYTLRCYVPLYSYL